MNVRVETKYGVSGKGLLETRGKGIEWNSSETLGVVVYLIFDLFSVRYRVLGMFRV